MAQAIQKCPLQHRQILPLQLKRMDSPHIDLRKKIPKKQLYLPKIMDLIVQVLVKIMQQK